MSGVSIHTNRKWCTPNARVAGNLRAKFKTITMIAGHPHAEVSSPNASQKIDELNIDMLRCYHEVALVFAPLIIDQNDHLSLAEILQNCLNWC
jgi:hypothetical protein